MFNKNVLICETNDVSCSVIPNCERIILNKNNITNLYKTIDEYKQHTNILIDSRCVELITYAFFKYTVGVYVYNVINNRIESVFVWARNTIKYNTNAYSIVYIKKMLLLMLFTNYYMKFVCNKPFFQPAEANKIIIETNHNVIKVDFILKFINRPYTTNDFDKVVYNKVLSILNFTNLDNIQPFDKTVSLESIQAVLSMLVSSEYVLKC